MKGFSQSRIWTIPTLVIMSSFLLAFAVLSQDRKEKPSSSKDTERLVEDLGSDIFEVRETATKMLSELEEEPTLLREVYQTKDLEVRRRIAKLLVLYERRRARRGRGWAMVLANEGRVDEMVERLVYWRDEKPREEEWKSVAELAVRLADWEHRKFGHAGFLTSGFAIPNGLAGKIQGVDGDLAPKELVDLWTRSDHRLGSEIKLDIKEVTLAHLVILASGRVQIPFLQGSLLIANGNVHVDFGVEYSILICDGDLELRHGLLGCLVIARGKVTCHESCRITGCTIITKEPIECQKGVTLKHSAMLPLDSANSPVKFFDSANMGLTVWQVYRGDRAMPDGVTICKRNGEPDFGDGVSVQSVRADSMFASGLRYGDIITAIGEKTPTKQIFRKVLRRRLADGKPILHFSVRREGKSLEVPIPVRE